MKIKNILLPVLAAAMIASCTPSLNIRSDYDHSVDFTGYKTYSLYNLRTKGDVNSLNADRIVKYIRAEMAKKGYQENLNNPDIMINAVSVLKNKQGIAASATSYGYGGSYRPYGYWGRPSTGYATVQTYDYKDGSLIIDIVDAKTKKLVWQGSANAEINRTPKDPDAAISDVIGKIMKDFPRH